MRIFKWLCAALVLAVAAPATAQDVRLNQGAFDRNTEEYRWGYNSIPSIPVVGAPVDTDWSRWAMLHDGQIYRLYAFRQNTQDRIYQFGFNPGTERYEWGYQSIPELRLVGMPRTATTRQFAMLHDGGMYRLYLQDRNSRTIVHQFGFNRGTQHYEYGHRSLPTIRVSGFPADADWRRWGMLHDGADYRFYTFRQGSGDQIYQAAFDAGISEYRYGYRSIPTIRLRGFPGGSNRSSFAMLHDGRDYRFYFKDR